MNKYLKYIRIVIALYFFSILFLSFLGIASIISNRALGESATSIQFIPSLLRSFLIPATGAGFVLVLILTIVYGRVYCSFICPLGTFQDISIRISKLFNKKKRFKFSKPHNLLRYVILVVVALSLLTGSVLLLNLLDPYSVFGKITSNVIRPIVIVINDALAYVVNKMGYYFMSPVGIKYLNWVAIIFSAIFLIALLKLTFSKGRIFCNTICPVGSLLSLASRFSIFKIKIDSGSCTSCGKCSFACKAECIDVKEKEVDFTRCVGCLNCLKVCEKKAINYSKLKLNKGKLSPASLHNDQKPLNVAGNNRRDFINKSIVLIGAGAVVTRAKVSAQPGKDVVLIKRKYPVTPPGSYSIENFTSHCTACHLCVSACPSQVLKPSFRQYGLAGIMQPYLDFNESFCDYECTICSEVCPTGAILPVHGEAKMNIQIGRVVFIKNNCIVKTEEKSCGACSEHCPTKAVRMVPYKGALTIPQTDQTICVGCGACEYACPAEPEKAIYVEGNLVHRTAFMFKDEKPNEAAPQEFPF